MKARSIKVPILQPTPGVERLRNVQLLSGHITAMFLFSDKHNLYVCYL